MRLLVLTALALGLLAAPALAQPPTLADLEDEVMCVECGTPLVVSQSPVANQERAFIQQQIAAGISVAVRRWRRNGPEPDAPLAPALSAEDARRLEAELGR